MAYLEEKIEQLQRELEDVKTTIKRLLPLPTDTFLTVKEVAARLTLSPAGVNYHIREGRLKAIGGRCKKIKETDLVEFENKYFNQDKIAN